MKVAHGPLCGSGHKLRLGGLCGQLRLRRLANSSVQTHTKPQNSSEDEYILRKLPIEDNEVHQPHQEIGKQKGVYHLQLPLAIAEVLIQSDNPGNYKPQKRDNAKDSEVQHQSQRSVMVRSRRHRNIGTRGETALRSLLQKLEFRRVH